jgi:hypothetical protein
MKSLRQWHSFREEINQSPNNFQSLSQFLNFFEFAYFALHNISNSI